MVINKNIRQKLFPAGCFCVKKKLCLLLNKLEGFCFFIGDELNEIGAAL